jgi:hypothetical protein
MLAPEIAIRICVWPCVEIIDERLGNPLLVQGSVFQANSGTPFTTIIGPDPLGLKSTDPADFPDSVRVCNPVHGGVHYLNVNCFALPFETPLSRGSAVLSALSLSRYHNRSRELARTFWAMPGATAWSGRD